MDNLELRPIIESMIFVSEEPMTESAVLLAMADAGVEKEQVRECIAEIERDWNENPARGMALARVAGGYQFRTKEGVADWLRRLAIPKPMRLSGPALETLAIVAYRQPIMRSEVEKIRGVDTGGVLKTLLERRLLRIVGRSQEPGQPLLYGTTSEFLKIFNLNTLKELPTLKDLEELMRERRAQAESGAVVAQGSCDEEDLTEVIGNEEEDETEIIKRRPLDENEEEEKKDMEALGHLESQLKSLRRLERSIFPKPEGEGAIEAVECPSAQDEGRVADVVEDSQQGPSGATGEEAAGTFQEEAADDAAKKDAASEVHRPLQ